MVAARPQPVFLFCPDYSPKVEVLVCRLGAGSTVNLSIVNFTVDRQLYMLTVRPSTQPMSNHGLLLAVATAVAVATSRGTRGELSVHEPRVKVVVVAEIP